MTATVPVQYGSDNGWRMDGLWSGGKFGFDSIPFNSFMHATRREKDRYYKNKDRYYKNSTRTW